MNFGVSLTLQKKIGVTENVDTIEIASDNALIADVLAGDESAFANLFERHKRAVARLAAKYFNQPQQVEEVVQIAFTNAYFALKNFHGVNDKSFIAWLLQIANNACLDILRRKKRKREDLLSELTDDETNYLRESLRDEKAANAENDVVAKDLADKLLSRLAPEEQAVLRMLDAVEMSVQEVSDSTGWSVSKVKIRAHRARKSLRKVLAKYL